MAMTFIEKGLLAQQSLDCFCPGFINELFLFVLFVLAVFVCDRKQDASS